MIIVYVMQTENTFDIEIITTTTTDRITVCDMKIFLLVLKLNEDGQGMSDALS